MIPGKIVVYVLCFASVANTAKFNLRQKRELRFPKGGSVVAAVALASFLPKGPTDGMAHVLEFDLGFPFPEKFSINKKQSLKKTWKNGNAIKPQKWYNPKMKSKIRRTKRNSKEKQRQDLSLKLEEAINRIGMNGSSCISRFRCEIREISPQNSLLEQVLVALFKTKSDETDCEKYRVGCSVSLLQIIMHSEQISS